jgi:hypothetical protein
MHYEIGRKISFLKTFLEKQQTQSRRRGRRRVFKWRGGLDHGKKGEAE